MGLTTKIAALLISIRREHLEQMPPAERKRLVDLCHYVANLAEPQVKQTQKPGILVELNNYRRES